MIPPASTRRTSMTFEKDGQSYISDRGIGPTVLPPEITAVTTAIHNPKVIGSSYFEVWLDYDLSKGSQVNLKLRVAVAAYIACKLCQCVLVRYVW